MSAPASLPGSRPTEMTARIINLADERAKRREPDLIEAWARLWVTTAFWFWGIR